MDLKELVWEAVESIIEEHTQIWLCKREYQMQVEDIVAMIEELAATIEADEDGFEDVDPFDTVEEARGER